MWLEQRANRKKAGGTVVRVILGPGGEGAKKVHVGLTRHSKAFGFYSEWEGLWATWSAVGFARITLAAVRAQSCHIVLWTPLFPLACGCNMTALSGGVLLEDVNSPLFSMLLSHCCLPVFITMLGHQWFLADSSGVFCVKFSYHWKKCGFYMVVEEILPRLAITTFGVEFTCSGRR